MRARAEDLRRDGRRIAVVPTMGALHEGHLTLLRAARERADIVILTIFVNPTQFGPNEDLRATRATKPATSRRRGTCGIDLAFCPDAAAMYPAGAQTFVEVRELQKPLCGASRPGHFAGVATVVSKLFNITQPHVAVFGEKDYQQLAIIRRMVRDLDFGIEIVGVPIVREPTASRCPRATHICRPSSARARSRCSKGLAAAEAAFNAGERDAESSRGRPRAARRRAARAHRLRRIRDADELSAVDARR